MKRREPKPLIHSLPVPAAPPPELLRALIARGLDPTEATIVLAYQLFHFPQNYLAEAFSLSDAKVKRALDKATALGFGRVSRRDLLERPRLIDEAKKQKILEKREKLMEQMRCRARLAGLPDDCRLGLLLQALSLDE